MEGWNGTLKKETNMKFWYKQKIIPSINEHASKRKSNSIHDWADETDYFNAGLPNIDCLNLAGVVFDGITVFMLWMNNFRKSIWIVIDLWPTTSLPLPPLLLLSSSFVVVDAAIATFATSTHQFNIITHHLELHSMCVHIEHSKRYTIQLIHIHRNFRLLNRFEVLAGELTFHNLIDGMNVQTQP